MAHFTLTYKLSEGKSLKLSEESFVNHFANFLSENKCCEMWSYVDSVLYFHCGCNFDNFLEKFLKHVITVNEESHYMSLSISYQLSEIVLENLDKPFTNVTDDYIETEIIYLDKCNFKYHKRDKDKSLTNFF